MLSLTSASKLEILERLREIAENLATLYEQLAFTRRTELELKTQAYQQSSSESISGRTRDAEISSAHATTSVWTIEAQIEAFKEEKYYLLKVLDYAIA